MAPRIILDRFETDDLISNTDTTGADVETAGATLKGYTDEVEAKVAEAFDLVRPLINETISNTNTQFTGLETRFGDTTNEGRFTEAALTAVSEGRTALQTVLTNAEEDEAATEAAVVQIIADYVARTVTNVQTPAQNVNASLTSMSGLLNQTQTSAEENDAAYAGRIGTVV